MWGIFGDVGAMESGNGQGVCLAEIEVIVSRSEGQGVSGMVTYKYLLKQYTLI